MSNILKDLAPRYNLTTGKSQAWGTVDGYWFVISQPPFGSNIMKISTAVSLPDENATAVLAKSLTEMMYRNREMSFQRVGGRIEVSLRKPSKDAGAMMIDAVLMRLVALFRLAGAVPACSHCGAASPGNFAMVDGAATKLCSGCEKGVGAAIARKAEEISPVKSNYPIGFLGAVLGALAGSLVWVLIGYLGIIAAVGGAAIAYCAIRGYRMMKGKVTVFAIVCICLICLAFMALAEFALYDIEAGKALISRGYAVDYWKLILQTFEVPSSFEGGGRLFLTDVGIGVLFAALVSWRMFKTLTVQAKTPAGKLEKH